VRDWHRRFLYAQSSHTLPSLPNPRAGRGVANGFMDFQPSAAADSAVLGGTLLPLASPYPAVSGPAAAGSASLGGMLLPSLTDLAPRTAGPREQLPASPTLPAA